MFIRLFVFWTLMCNCYGASVEALFNQTREEDPKATTMNNRLCGIPINFEYGNYLKKEVSIQEESVYFDKRDGQDEHDPFADPVQVLRTRLLFLEKAAKCLLKATDPHLHVKNKEITKVKNYFEQLLIEKWSKDLPENQETSALDDLIASIFTILQPVYERPWLRQRLTEPEISKFNREISSFEKRFDDFRSVLVHNLHTKSQQYRDSNLQGLKSQLRDTVVEFYNNHYPATVQKSAVDILIETTLELSEWVGQEYTQNHSCQYTKAQWALSARMMERLLTLNATLHTIPLSKVLSGTDYDVFFRVVAHTQAHASEFLNVNFPDNKITRKNTKLFREIFAKIRQLESRTTDESHYVTFDDLMVHCMWQKLNAVKRHLSDLEPVASLPTSAYWKLLQMKIDLRHWDQEISTWSKITSDKEINELHKLCEENITEVNRLKRTFDRHVPPETA